MLAGATLVFDLDGTLADTLPDIAAAANAVLGEAGQAPLPPDRVASFVGEGSRVLLARCFAARGLALDGPALDRAYAAFLDYHGRHLVEGTRLYPGVEAALDRLSEARLAVCTNKPGVLARGVLDALGLAKRFAFVAGGDAFDVRKPHPDALTLTIARAGGNPAHAVMVGDSVTDLETARAAGIPFIGFDFGYSDPPMRSLAPDALLSDYAYLDQAVRDLLGAPGLQSISASGGRDRD